MGRAMDIEACVGVQRDEEGVSVSGDGVSGGG